MAGSLMFALLHLGLFWLILYLLYRRRIFFSIGISGRTKIRK
jgi:predicted acyltransferase